MSENKKEKKRPRLDVSENRFLKKYSQIIYAIILIVLIPSIIIGNTIFVINKFRGNIDSQLQRQALIISELINATTIRDSADLRNIQARLSRVFTGPDEIQSLDIMVPENEDFLIIASGIESNIGELSTGINNILAWHNDRAIAHLTKPSAQDIAANPELRDQRFWNVVSPIHDENGERIALLNLKMSIQFIDELTKQTLTASFFLLFATLIIVLLLLLVNTRLFQYAILFRKLEEVDEMKDEFISMASHELRTPITAINGYVSMFMDGSFGTLSDAGSKGMGIIEASIKRLGSLVEDLLNVSRIEQNRLQIKLDTVSADEVISSVITELSVTAQSKNLELKYDKPASIPPVTADQDKLHQVLVNIIGNSIKYTKEGSVTVSVTEEENEMIKIKVKDTGIGMSSKDREQLFQKFYRVKNENTKGIVGTGLGLWITKQLVNLMGGEIYVDSIEGSGTEMSFTLKKAKAQGR